MAHKQQQNFIESVKSLFPNMFKNKRVLDCGSLDINGNNRIYFEDCDYVGIDVVAGNNVDNVSKIHEWTGSDYDAIICTEALEHDVYWKQSLKHMAEMLKSTGLLIITCATGKRKEHGTVNHQPDCSGTSKIKGWESYYENRSMQDVYQALNVNNNFSKHEFRYDRNGTDLYFWGIKK